MPTSPTSPTSPRTPYRPSLASQQEVVDTARVMDRAWETIQKKTFTKWVNTKLDVKGIRPMQDLETEFTDGVNLIQLLEIISDTSLGKYNKSPRMRVQKAENVNKALEYIKQHGINLTNIGAEDIIDAKLKLILGLLWTIILRFTIADINEEGLTAKEGLLLWCQRKTAPYADVNVKDFTYSWTDGLAFCALIHRHRPDLLDYDKLNKSDRHGNTALAFEVAERYLNIPKLLDVEDVCDIAKPDERSVMTYVAEYFHAFSALDKVETAGRRVAKFGEVLATSWQSQNDFERRVKALIDSIRSKEAEWENNPDATKYSDAKRHSAEFAQYKNTEKRAWVSEKRDLDALFTNIQTKLKTYGLRPYRPSPGLTLADLDNVWNRLLNTENSRHRQINGTIRNIKENLRKSYANAANDFQKQLDSISAELVSLDGDLDRQLERVKALIAKVNPLKATLSDIASIDEQCQEANIDDNDYTVYTMDDLSFELDLIQQALAKKSAFIENQIVSRNMTNLTPAQLEEFESTFRFFDKDHSNSLGREEFNAALASQSIVYDDNEFNSIFDRMAQGQPEATFEQFITFMVSVMEDQTSPDQLRQSFKAVAGDKPYVTELDLKMCLVPQSVITHFVSTMPSKGEGFDYSQYLDQVFS